MDKSLTMVSSMPPIGANAMTGKNNFNVNNQDGGVVNFNYNFYGNDTTDNTEKMIAVQSFSKEYYQLIVTLDDGIFQNNVVSVGATRALLSCNVPSEIYESCSSLTEEGKEILKKIPAIVCMENTDYHGVTSLNQWAIYCYIKLIKKQGKDIKIAFRPLGLIPQHKMCEEEASVYFDLDMDCAITDLNKGGWSVHKVNLFEAFAIAGIENVPIPN